jgi:hypothetical protein
MLIITADFNNPNNAPPVLSIHPSLIALKNFFVKYDAVITKTKIIRNVSTKPKSFAIAGLKPKNSKTFIEKGFIWKEKRYERIIPKILKISQINPLKKPLIVKTSRIIRKKVSQPEKYIQEP